MISFTCRFLGILFLIQSVVVISPPPVRTESLASSNTGRVMVLEYHKIDRPESRWTRTPENFRKDLQRFYDKGYQLIRMDEFLENRIRVGKGKTPLILTFDDSSPGQLRFLPDGKGGYRVDPDCAVGILESFHAKHPDFGLAAIFYVLPAADPPNKLFNQPEYAQEKLRYLVRKGFEIGNHTLWHATLSKQSAEGVRRQLALAVKAIQEAVPGYEVKSLSLPMGIYPKDISILKKGSYDGVSYHNKGVVMVTGGPAFPPSHKSFDSLRIPRIQAVEREINYWLRYFDEHPEERYAGG